MGGIAGTGEHHVLSVDLSREEDSVAVEGDVRILQAGEGLEIRSLNQAYCCSVEVEAADYVVLPFDLDKAGIIVVGGFVRLSFLVRDMDRFRVELPSESILGMP